MRTTLLLFSALLCAASTVAQHVLPGDDTPVPPIGHSRKAAIAAGGPGSLVVWEDSRTVMAGQGGQDLRMGNQTEIYGQLLSPSGQPLLAAPLVIGTGGRNQLAPRVAWNGQCWLVVFVTERPDWWFFQDVVGVRVDAAGTVLDSTPIVIRAEAQSPANYRGSNPSVGSDGTNWIVVWEDWNPANSRPNLRGARVAPGGQVLDPQWRDLYEYTSPSFGPRDPQIAFAGGTGLLVWRDLVTSRAFARRLSPALQPLGAEFTIAATPTTTQRATVASDGAQFYVTVYDRLFRVAATGTVLDPAGILVATGGASVDTVLHCAWNGSSLSVVNTRGGASGLEVFLTRVDAAGTVLDQPSIQVTSHPASEFRALVAGNGAGGSTVVFAAQGAALSHLEDFRTVHVDAAGTPAPHVDVDAGLPRHQDVRLVATPSGHVAAWVSVGSYGSRLLAARLDAAGNPLDPVPTVVASWPMGFERAGDVACSGVELAFAWTDAAGQVFARRYDLALQPLDPQPVPVLPLATGTPAIAAANGDFLVAAIVPLTNHVNSVRGVRLQGGTSTVLDATPIAIGGNHARDVRVDALGGGWVVHWSRAPTHDLETTVLLAATVSASGQASPPQQASTTSHARASDLAVLGGEALLVYQCGIYGQDGIRARRLGATGAPSGTELVVCDDAAGQVFPSVAVRGDDWLVTWNDHRRNAGIEQARGDVFVARVRADGAVLDPGGIAVTSTALPEDDPVVSGNGACLVAYVAMARGGAPRDVQRVVVERIDDLLPLPWRTLPAGVGGALGEPALAGFGELVPGTPMRLEATGAAPFAFTIQAVGLSRLDLPFLGALLVPSPDLMLLHTTDAGGRASLALPWLPLPPGLQLWHQFWFVDPTGPLGHTATDALVSTSR